MFTALHSASTVLSNVALAELRSVVPDLGFAAGTKVVSLNSPYEMSKELKAEGLSIWLYRVVRDETRLNAPPRRLRDDRLEHPPLPLRLHYLMTAVTLGTTGGVPELEQKIMGRALQAFHARPTLRAADLIGTEFEGTDTELHLHLESLPLDELARIWDALQGTYQLSVSYEVSLVHIDARAEPERVAPVRVAMPDYGVIVGGGSAP
jgi:hypothetical protein